MSNQRVFGEGPGMSCLESGGAQNSCAGGENKPPAHRPQRQWGAQRSCQTGTEKRCVWDGGAAARTGVSSIRHINKPSTFAGACEASAGVLCPEMSMLKNKSRKMQPMIVRLRTLTHLGKSERYVIKPFYFCNGWMLIVGEQIVLHTDTWGA